MYNRPRGTQDIYGDDAKAYRKMEEKFIKICTTYGFTEIRTPIFEHIDVFVRSVGDTSDIVKKEFYNFQDKGGREIALRPEGTASVIRAVVEEKMLSKLPSPLRLFYSGPMFRYERPQGGRMRQFNQIGCEIINTNSVYDDAFALKLALEGIKKAGIGVDGYKIYINNLGNFESRKLWIDELKKYFSRFESELTPLSQERLKTNPTRILDDKIDGVKDFVKNAPKISRYLSPSEKDYQTKLERILKEMKIEYIKDENLVRGLDYYTNFIFEIVSTSKVLEGQSTLCGGGRYSKLVGEFGGEDASSVGFAWGMDRIITVLKTKIAKSLSRSKIRTVVVACLQPYANSYASEVDSYRSQPHANSYAWEVDSYRSQHHANSYAPEAESCALEVESYALEVVQHLLEKNFTTIYRFHDKLIKTFNYAQKTSCQYVLIIGLEEWKNKNVIIKNQKTKEQQVVHFDDIVKYLRKKTQNNSVKQTSDIKSPSKI